MVHIKITKGLDIPIKGQPKGAVQDLARPDTVSLSLRAFEQVKFKVLVKTGDVVKIGQPLALDKDHPDRVFVAPASGMIIDVLRGHKRHPTNITIRMNRADEYIEGTPHPIQSANRDELMKALLAGGLFCHIRQRPFNTLADPTKMPRSIFVKALESAPFAPPAELQVAGNEKEFAAGLQALSKLTPGAVHLVYRQDTPCKAFTEATHVQHHTTEGPHPIANHSLHIQTIDPITAPEDVIWTVSALDVVAIGHYLLTGKPYIYRVVSVAGPGIVEERAGYFKARAGHPVSGLIANKIPRGYFRFISGDPLTGEKVDAEDYLNFYDTTFSVIPEAVTREFLHFFRPGLEKYTASKCYVSGHLHGSHRQYDFTTSLHGEHRAFVTNTPYDKVMPLRISTMLLCKAVMAEDYELADQMGLLEVAPEDFALPTFVCPSKIEIMDIIKHGLITYKQEVLP